jgi:hypothetical protein
MIKMNYVIDGESTHGERKSGESINKKGARQDSLLPDAF